MRLNPHSPSDNPMEQLLYCFGGGGDSGGSDGTDDGDVGTAGYGGGVGVGGQASDSSGNFGGGGNDNDLGFDEGDVGGVSVGGFAQAPGPSGGFSDSPGLAAAYGSAGITPSARGFYADPIGAPQYPQAPNFGAPRGTPAPGFAPPNFAARSTVDVADLDAMAEIQDALAAGGRTDITSGEQTGTTDLSTMIDPSNAFDPFGDGFMSPEENAANMAALQRSLALPSLSLNAPTMPAPDITISVPAAEMEGIIGSNIGGRGWSTRPSGTPGVGIANIGGVDYSFDNTVPADQRTYTTTAPDGTSTQQERAAAAAAAAQAPAFNTLDFDRAVAEEEGRRAAQAAPAGPRSTALGPVADITVSYGKPRDAVDQSIDRAISDFAGYRVGQERKFDADGNVTTEDFALSRDLVSQPPEFGAAYNPAEQLRMQEGMNAMPAFNVPDIPTPIGNIPASIVGRIASDILTPASAVERALREGATPIPDAQGRIAGAVDERGTVYSTTPFGDIISGIKGELAPGMKEAYDAQRAMQEAEMARSGGDGGGQAPEPVVLPDPVTEECPAGYVRDGSGACIYQGQDVVRPGSYTPGPAPTFNYTGIPSLAPFTLRPSARLPVQPVDPFALLRSPRS